MADLLERISAFADRARQLEETLGQPEVASNPTEYRRIAQELSGLRPAASAAQDYRKLLADIEGARALLGEGDADMRELAQVELAELEERRTALEKQIRVLLLPRDPDDEKGAILEIRAGAGGEEAGLFAHELLRMYLRYAERRGWKVEPMSLSQAGAGIREAITGLSGERVFGRLKLERGVHRVQRVPATEAQGRIHTSTVTVAVLPEAEEVDVQINPADLRIDVYRSSGPGGQSVNTTDSAVRITHLPTNTVVTCQDEKSQHKNKAKALKVLRSRLLEVERERAAANRANARRAQVGTGDRSEKIRTYNFPQSRVTDHRAGVTMHQLDALLAGDMDELLDAVQSSLDEQDLA
ncbi:MAG TPA: peptide chain release factor 1 [Myxococcota bacterium]|jgi:peptide chain release factor 1|nr:peptide chain release factor 1 [Myxococcota bacterium]